MAIATCIGPHPPDITLCISLTQLLAGLYAASAGRDGRVCIWDMATATCIARATSASAAAATSPATTAVVSGLAWSSTSNELALADDQGNVGVWVAPIPEDLKGPAVPLEELVRQALSQEGER